MTFSTAFVSCVLLTLIVSAVCLTDLQQELLEKQQSASDGVIACTEGFFQRYVVGKSRPYSLVFMFTAEEFMDKPKLSLRALRREFGLAAKAYKDKYTADNTRAGKVLFVEVELSQNRNIFNRFSVESLPFVFRLSPHMIIKKSGTIEVPYDEKMSFERYQSYPWKAESFADFVKRRAGVAVEEIPRSDFLSSRLSAALILLFLGSTIWSATRLYQSPLLQNKWIWMIGTVIVCWFSTSGGMYNIIRGTPFAIPKDGKIQLVYPSNGQQLGAEGFMAGTMYVIFSGGFLLMTYGVPNIKNPIHRRVAMLFAICIVLVFLRQIIGLYKMKTGYPIQQYMITAF